LNQPCELCPANVPHNNALQVTADPPRVPAAPERSR
jgi:hypothetical protein